MSYGSCIGTIKFFFNSKASKNWSAVCKKSCRCSLDNFLQLANQFLTLFKEYPEFRDTPCRIYKNEKSDMNYIIQPLEKKKVPHGQPQPTISLKIIFVWPKKDHISGQVEKMLKKSVYHSSQLSHKNWGNDESCFPIKCGIFFSFNPKIV